MTSRKRPRPKPNVRFSDYFKLGKTQAELDFVDVPLDTDIPLFVDPYALSLDDDPWFVECNDLVVDYFQFLIDSIRDGKDTVALQLLSNLHEPNETRLGFSSSKPSGRGVGSTQAKDLYARLRKSKAVRTGKLRDLSDCELLIPGISGDKISDITINIIRGKLVEYTEAQCVALGIPTLQVPSGLYWDLDRRAWRNRYARLPVFSEERVILVPKAAVRFRLEVDHQVYYRRFVLEYLQAEHLQAGSSLVQILKNGKRKVYKKDLRAKYPVGKEFLYEFSEKHPEVLERYKKSLSNSPAPLMDEDIEAFQSQPRPIDLKVFLAQLNAIPPGQQGAPIPQFHYWRLGSDFLSKSAKAGKGRAFARRTKAG